MKRSCRWNSTLLTLATAKMRKTKRWRERGRQYKSKIRQEEERGYCQLILILTNIDDLYRLSSIAVSLSLNITRFCESNSTTTLVFKYI